MCKYFSVILILIVITGTCFASTEEAKALNFWQEFDLTFWQTVPFAALWGYFAASQLAGGAAVNWSPVAGFTVAASALNAYRHAKKVTAK